MGVGFALPPFRFHLFNEQELPMPLRRSFVRSTFILVVTMAMTLGATLAHAVTYTPTWSHGLGGPALVAVDPSGNVYVTGSFSGTLNLGTGNLVSAGGTDILLAKYNPSGTCLWSKSFGAGGPDAGIGIALDAAGNVAITGEFVGNVDFGGGPLASSGGSADIFLAKFNSAGSHVWSKRFGDTTSTDVGRSVAFDSAGNVIVTGGFSGTVDFGGGPFTAPHVFGFGYADAFLAKYSPTGVHLWSKQFGAELTDLGRAVAVDGADNIYLTGEFAQSINLGGTTFIGGANGTAYLAKFNASGTHLWSKDFGDNTTNSGLDLAVDSGNNVIVVGSMLYGDFGGGMIFGLGGDTFVAKYDASGTYQWAKDPGLIGNDFATAVKTDAAGNVFVCGEFFGIVNFGGGNLVAPANQDLYLAKYTPAGGYLWAASFGGPGDDSATDVAVDLSGNIILAGGYDLPGNAGQNITKFGPGEERPFVSSIVDVGNDQGKQVRVAFTRSAHDRADDGTPITQYQVFRKIKALPPSAVQGGIDAAPRTLLLPGYDTVGTIIADGSSSYNVVVPTLADSTVAHGQYFSVFFVRAVTATPTTFFDAPVDSGYSRDNLAPGIPQNLVYGAGALTWSASSATDFDYFTVYGSNSNNFAGATRLGYTVSPAKNVSGYLYYFVTATDFSGNQGKPATLNTLTGVGGTPASYALSVSNYPNPFNPRTTVSYTVPSRGHVSITIYDTNGALVRTLFNGEHNAGAFTTEWDGLADNGSAVGSGIYFARIVQNGETRTNKMTILK
jgi:hypothetical protein